MRQVQKRPLVTNHWPLFLLAVSMIIYGTITFFYNRHLGRAFRLGLISIGKYQASLAEFTYYSGLAASLLILLLAAWCFFQSRGSVRTAFGFMLPASFGPLLTAQASKLLFEVLGLPTMGAGSVLAATFAALVFTLPMVIAFFILAGGRKNPRAVRWLALLGIFITLAAMIYPLYVTVLALLIMPGSPGLAPHMSASSYLLYLRFVLPGLCLFLIGLASRAKS